MTKQIDIDTWPVVIVVTSNPELPLCIATDCNPEEIAELAGKQELELIELQLQHALSVVQQAMELQHREPEPVPVTEPIFFYQVRDDNQKVILQYRTVGDRGQPHVLCQSNTWVPSAFETDDRLISHYDTYIRCVDPSEIILFEE
jgi:hypothetical protein